MKNAPKGKWILVSEEVRQSLAEIAHAQGITATELVDREMKKIGGPSVRIFVLKQPGSSIWEVV